MVRRRKIDITVAKNIAKELKRRKMAASSLAEKVEMSRQLLNHKLHRGRFYLDDIVEIADKLDITVGELTNKR